ncbi:unnamed protein product [[Actinomadura] parvosata subsp. kistnae]|nr:unnamed protein product [Actinomadura parvosata subsp. kistnae]
MAAALRHGWVQVEHDASAVVTEAGANEIAEVYDTKYDTQESDPWYTG